MKFEYELWVRYLCYTHTQSCLPLCDSMDCSLPGSTGYRIFQARILKWVVISSSKGTVPTQGSNPLSHWGSHNSAIVVLSSGFSRGSVGKESTCRAGDTGSVPGLGRSPGEGHGNPVQCSCLENPMDWRAWQAIAYRVTKSSTCLKTLSTHACNVKFPEFNVLNFRKFTWNDLVEKGHDVLNFYWNNSEKKTFWTHEHIDNMRRENAKVIGTKWKLMKEPLVIGLQLPYKSKIASK